MEGTWGRRVWGEVENLGNVTRFYLEIDMGEDLFKSVFIASNDHLEEHPEYYGVILNKMTKTLDKQLQRSKNTP